MAAVMTYRVRIESAERVSVERRDFQHELLGEISGRLDYQGARRQRIDDLARRVADYRASPDDLVALGEALFAALWEPPLQTTFYGDYDRVCSTPDARLRLLLDVDETALPAIAALPWEFMRAGGTYHAPFWLATASRLTFARHRRRPHSPGLLPLVDRLRVQVALAAPDNLPAIEHGKLWEHLRSVTAGQPIELLPPLLVAQISSMRTALGERPHVFHLIAHGRFDGGVGQIALPNDTGRAQWVAPEVFASVFDDHRPDVVILQICNGAARSPDNGLAEIVAPIILQNVPVVIAMQYEIQAADARRFAKQLYSELADGRDIEHAVQLSRRCIPETVQEYTTHAFATPVLYSSLERPLHYPILTAGPSFLTEAEIGSLTAVFKQITAISATGHFEMIAPTVFKIAVLITPVHTGQELFDAMQQAHLTRTEFDSLCFELRYLPAQWETANTTLKQLLIRCLEEAERDGKLAAVKEALLRVRPQAGQYLPAHTPEAAQLYAAAVEPSLAAGTILERQPYNGGVLLLVTENGG